MRGSDTHPWTLRDAVVALAALGLTVGLLANGHGSARAIDVPGVG